MWIIICGYSINIHKLYMVSIYDYLCGKFHRQIAHPDGPIKGPESDQPQPLQCLPWLDLQELTTPTVNASSLHV